MEPRRIERRSGAGALVFGALFLLVGGYYLFRNTFGFSLPELDGEAVWPIFVVAIGGVLLLRGATERPSPDPR
jgi:hypothetical protein